MGRMSHYLLGPSPRVRGKFKFEHLTERSNPKLQKDKSNLPFLINFQTSHHVLSLSQYSFMICLSRARHFDRNNMEKKNCKNPSPDSKRQM